VAKAIVAVVRKQAQARTGRHQHVGYVWLKGVDTDVVVLQEDWELIFPFIQDGTFSPMLTPTQSRVGFLRPEIHYKAPTIDIRDKGFYRRVLNTLQGLFTEEFPTSNL
jgi:hypothetical protein